MQSAQVISAAYYFDLAARDYILADSAIELVVEGVPCSAFIEPSQSCELIFCDFSDRLRAKKPAADGGKFRRDLQEHSGCAMSARVGHRLTFTRHLSRILVPMIRIKPPRYQTLIERSITAGGFETEKYYVIDSPTKARIVKCRNQQESEKIAGGLNGATKFRWVKLLSD